MTTTTFDASARSTVWFYALQFLGVGGALLGIGWWEGWGWTPRLLASTPFLILGVLAASLRVQITVDARRRRLVKSIRVLGIPHRRRIPWTHFTGLELQERSIPNSFRGGTRDVHYPVVLVGGDEPLDLFVSPSYTHARRRAGELTRLFDLPLVDSARGEALLLRSEEVDQPLASRASSAGSDLSELEEPPTDRLSIRAEPDEVILEVGASGPNVAQSLGVVCGLVLIGLTVANAPEVEGLRLGLLLLLVGVPGLWLALSTPLDMLRAEHLFVTADEVEVQSRTPLTSKRTILSSEEVRDVSRDSDLKSVVIQARDSRCTVGNVLREDEAEWLVAAVHAALAATAPRPA